MNKEIIIFSLFAIIICLILYYDIYRYIKIHFDDESEYVNKYRKLKKYQNSRVVISLTTVPERVKLLKPVIKSLLDQSVKVDQIVLNLPKMCKERPYDVPDDLKNMCNIFTCGRDYGPGTKFIPTILREQEADTIIIMLDDDYIYGYKFIETLLDEYNRNPDCAIILKEAILLKPEFLDTSVIYTNKKYIDNDWIKKYINSEQKIMNYRNNLRTFMY
jgi:hypothetical protein